MVDVLFPFALDRFGKTFFEAAWLDFWLGDPPSTKEFTDVPEFDAMFVPWFVTRFVADRRDGRAEPHWPDVPVGLHWLASAASRIDPREREWLLAACASPMSVFTIEAVDSGRSVDIRDMLTGRRFHVLEQRGSQGLHEGDLYFTRVVTTGDASLMFGAAPYAFPPRFQLQALDWRDGLFGRRAPRRSQLDEYEREIRRAYLVFADQLLNPAPPRLQNTDGDDLALTTLEYEVRIPVAEVLERLRPLATLGADEHISDVVEDASGAVRRPAVGQAWQQEDEAVGQRRCTWSRRPGACGGEASTRTRRIRGRALSPAPNRGSTRACPRLATVRRGSCVGPRAAGRGCQPSSQASRRARMASDQPAPGPEPPCVARFDLIDSAVDAPPRTVALRGHDFGVAAILTRFRRAEDPSVRARRGSICLA